MLSREMARRELGGRSATAKPTKTRRLRVKDQKPWHDVTFLLSASPNVIKLNEIVRKLI